MKSVIFGDFQSNYFYLWWFSTVYQYASTQTSSFVACRTKAHNRLVIMTSITYFQNDAMHYTREHLNR